MSKTSEARGIDVPIGQLHALNERKPKERSFKRLVASIRAVGLIEPLCIFKEGERYVILDGYLRYLACLELGFEEVPCLLYKTKESYSYNKMVNSLSPIQEHRMIQKSLETLDEKTLARALGVTSLTTHHHKKTVLAKLAPELAEEYDAGRINGSCAKTLTFVKHERQVEILKHMKRTGDFTPSFARAMVVQTPAKLREKLPPKRRHPWDQEEQKQSLLQRFNEADDRYDFYVGVHNQYSADLVKLCIYVRKLLTNEQIRKFLESNHADICKHLNSIIFEPRDIQNSKETAQEGSSKRSVPAPTG